MDPTNPPENPFAKTVVPIRIEDEMRNSYMDYSMSVIVGRALPDVRDGLKPVHRRILYAMYREGIHANKKYSKCAGVVGENELVHLASRCGGTDRASTDEGEQTPDRAHRRYLQTYRMARSICSLGSCPSPMRPMPDSAKSSRSRLTASASGRGRLA